MPTIGPGLKRISAVITTSRALDVGMHHLVDATAATRTLTLPTNTPAGRELAVERVDSNDRNDVLIAGTMRGAADSVVTLRGQGRVATFLSEGAGSWRPTGDYADQVEFWAPVRSLLDPHYPGSATQGFSSFTTVQYLEENASALAPDEARGFLRCMLSAPSARLVGATLSAKIEPRPNTAHQLLVRAYCSQSGANLPTIRLRFRGVAGGQIIDGDPINLVVTNNATFGSPPWQTVTIPIPAGYSNTIANISVEVDCPSADDTRWVGLDIREWHLVEKASAPQGSGLVRALTSSHWRQALDAAVRPVIDFPRQTRKTIDQPYPGRACFINEFGYYEFNLATDLTYYQQAYLVLFDGEPDQSGEVTIRIVRPSSLADAPNFRLNLPPAVWTGQHGMSYQFDIAGYGDTIVVLRWMGATGWVLTTFETAVPPPTELAPTSITGTDLYLPLWVNRGVSDAAVKKTSDGLKSIPVVARQYLRSRKASLTIGDKRSFILPPGTGSAALQQSRRQTGQAVAAIGLAFPGTPSGDNTCAFCAPTEGAPKTGVHETAHMIDFEWVTYSNPNIPAGLQNLSLHPDFQALYQACVADPAIDKNQYAFANYLEFFAEVCAYYWLGSTATLTGIVGSSRIATLSSFLQNVGLS